MAAPTDYLDLIPLYQESAATVRARLNADVNAGLASDDSRWLDIREGSFFHDITQPFVLEIARLWDALGTEVVAASMPVLAWGPYLEAHAAVFTLNRNPAAPASGLVLFVGDQGTLIPTNLIVSADPGIEEADAVSFATTASGTIAGGKVAPVVTPTPAEAGGVLGPGTWEYAVTVVTDFGESDAPNHVTVNIAGSTGKVSLDWPDVATAVAYRIYRGLNGGQMYRIDETALSLYADAGGQTLGVAGPPAVNNTAGVRINVVATAGGAGGNVAASSITNIDSPINGVNGVTNESPLTGGTEQETDSQLRTRVLGRYASQGGGNITDYEQWSLEYPGVERVTVIPLISGPGTVGVVPMLADGSPVGTTTVTGLQAHLDPVAQQGKGRAPIGHGVAVSTPTINTIPLVATIQFEGGYSLDGAGGTTALRTRIVQAVTGYINSLEVGEDVIFDAVKSRFYDVAGVFKVTALTVEGGTTDVPITSSPAQIARIGTVTLT